MPGLEHRNTPTRRVSRRSLVAWVAAVCVVGLPVWRGRRAARGWLLRQDDV